MSDPVITQTLVNLANESFKEGVRGGFERAAEWHDQEAEKERKFATKLAAEGHENDLVMRRIWGHEDAAKQFRRMKEDVK